MHLKWVSGDHNCWVVAWREEFLMQVLNEIWQFNYTTEIIFTAVHLRCSLTTDQNVLFVFEVQFNAYIP